MGLSKGWNFRMSIVLWSLPSKEITRWQVIHLIHQSKHPSKLRIRNFMICIFLDWILRLHLIFYAMMPLPFSILNHLVYKHHLMPADLCGYQIGSNTPYIDGRPFSFRLEILCSSNESDNDLCIPKPAHPTTLEAALPVATNRQSPIEPLSFHVQRM